MQQKELKQLQSMGDVSTVMAVNRGDHWNIAVDTDDGGFAVIRSARGGKREFKTLDAVSAMLKEVDIKSFSVC
jgi:hypothetical protein